MGFPHFNSIIFGCRYPVKFFQKIQDLNFPFHGFWGILLGNHYTVSITNLKQFKIINNNPN